MNLWRPAALVTVVVACVQAYLVIDRVREGITLGWKGWSGAEGVFLTAGVGSLILFVFATAGFTALGLLAGDRLRQTNSRWRFMAGLGVHILLAGAVVWIGLILSPAVEVVGR